jgi:hypothetical protein
LSIHFPPLPAKTLGWTVFFPFLGFIFQYFLLTNRPGYDNLNSANKLAIANRDKRMEGFHNANLNHWRGPADSGPACGQKHHQDTQIRRLFGLLGRLFRLFGQLSPQTLIFPCF